MVFGGRMSGGFPFVALGLAAGLLLGGGADTAYAQSVNVLLEGTREPDKLLRFGRGSVLVGTDAPGPAILTLHDRRIEISPGVSKLVPAGSYDVTINGEAQADIYVERGRVSVIVYAPASPAVISESEGDIALTNRVVENDLSQDQQAQDQQDGSTGASLAGTIQVEGLKGLITLFSTDGRIQHLSFAKPRPLAPGDYTLRYGLNPKNVNIELLPGEEEIVLPSDFNLSYLTLENDMAQDITLIYANGKVKTIASGKTYAIQAGPYEVLYGQSEIKQLYTFTRGRTHTLSVMDFPVGYVTSNSAIPKRYIKDIEAEIPIAKGQTHILSEGTYQLYEDELMLWEFKVHPGKTAILE